MWCHLCKLNFTNYETFKCHIMEKHKSSDDFYKDDSDSEKSEENSIEIPDDFDLDSDIDEDNEITNVKDVETSQPQKIPKRLNLSPPIKNSEPIKNNQYCILSPLVDQNTQNQITYVMNPSFCNTSQISGDFGGNAENTQKWLTAHQALCQNMKYPLSSSLFEKVQHIQKEICRQYCMSPTATEDTEVIFKIYEDLTNMILKHIKTINDLMS